MASGDPRSDTADNKGPSSEMEYTSVDDHYCSPNAKLVLISKDKVAFRTDAWHMSRQSEFIRNLLDVPSEQSIEAAPIHLDHTTNVVRYFLDLLTPSPSANILVEVELCSDLFRLADMFGTPRVEKYILDSMRVAMRYEKGKKPPLDAWEVFKVAAKRDDIALAKAAIRCFESSGRNIADLIVSSTPGFFDGVPPPYFYALMRCFLQIRENTFTYQYTPGDQRQLSVRDVESAINLFRLT